MNETRPRLEKGVYFFAPEEGGGDIHFGKKLETRAM